MRDKVAMNSCIRKCSEGSQASLLIFRSLSALLLSRCLVSKGAQERKQKGMFM